MSMTQERRADMESKKLTIAFDVDGVLRDLVQYTLDNQMVLDALPPNNRKRPSEIRSYGEFVSLFASKKDWRRLLDECGAWKYSPHHGSMIDLFGVLRQKGHNCIIVTSNSHRRGQMETVEWLHQHLAEHRDGLDIHFVNDKLSVKYDAIFEDMPLNAKLASDAGRLAFLVKRPWTDLENQKGAMKGDLVTKWNPMLLVRLPEDINIFTVVTEKLAWFQGYRDGVMLSLKARAGVD